MSFNKLIVWNVPLLLVVVFAWSLIGHASASVSYDHKAITINGQRRILLSGSIHYPRSTPEVLYSNVFHGFIHFNFLPNGCLKVSPFSDVARSYSEGQGGRVGCDSDLCFLEWARAFTWQGNSNY